MANIVNLEKELEQSTRNLPDYNHLLGRTLLQPFKPANSGSRALMSSIHAEHLMVPAYGEIPIIQTGFETKFGIAGTSYVESKSNYKILHKIEKFEGKNSHYYLIVQDLETGIYDVIERTPYKHNTESYGFLWRNDKIDRYKPGDNITKGSIIKTSNGFDEFGSKMNGVNLVTMYLSCAQNMEDSIIISESAAKKLATNLVKNTSITINDNDILLNMYGDTDRYKTFPDVGEEIQGGIFCSIRRLENENMLYSLSQSRLREPMMSDRNILLNGTVVDIDVYCNNPSVLGDSYYNQQLFYYYNQRNTFCQKLVDAVAPLAMNGKLSYDLQKLYAICRDSINGKQYFKDKMFSNVIMEVTIVERLPMDPGDKMCDRYGGKGVVSKIVQDDLMPILDNGVVVEVIKNQSTCINRENIGQLHEQSLTFIGMRIIDYLRLNIGLMSYPEMANIVYQYMRFIDQDEANEFRIVCQDFADDWTCQVMMDGILNDGYIIMSTPPFTTPIRLDTIAEMYKAFPFIKPYEVYVSMEDSNGNIRRVKTRRPLVAGRIYNYRLKQYAEEKFSVTSLSATNLKGLNTRSKANKIYETKFTKTPIMFGPMESGDLAHLGMSNVVMNLMLYSSSPQARRLFEQLLIGDPYDINIKLDKDSKNRNAEIINALLKTMGLRIVFKKIPKKPKIMAYNIMVKDVPNDQFHYKTNIRDIIGHDDELAIKYSVAMHDRRNNPMCGLVMVKKVDNNDSEYVTKAGLELRALIEGESESSK